MVVSLNVTVDISRVSAASLCNPRGGAVFAALKFVFGPCPEFLLSATSVPPAKRAVKSGTIALR